jgi:trehalose-6-phosphatase
VLPLELDGTLLTKMAVVTEEAIAAVAHIPGATVEDNQFSVSIHFRNCAADDWFAVCTPSLRLASHAW